MVRGTAGILQKPKGKAMKRNEYNGMTFTYSDSVETLSAQTEAAMIRKAELRAAGQGGESIVTLLDMVHYLRTGGSMEQQEVAKVYGVSKSHISKACKVVREALPATVARTGKAWGMTDEEVAATVVQFVVAAGQRAGINSLYEDLGKDDDEPKVWSFAEQAAVLAKRAYKRAGMTPDEMVEAFAAVVAGMTFE